jgi:hypothetical protein
MRRLPGTSADPGTGLPFEPTGRPVVGDTWERFVDVMYREWHVEHQAVIWPLKNAGLLFGPSWFALALSVTLASHGTTWCQ